MNSQLLPYAGCGVNSAAVPAYTTRTISVSIPLIAVSFVAGDTQLSSIQISIASISSSPVITAYIVPNDSSGASASTPNTSPVTNAIASATGNISLVSGINSISFNSNTLTAGTVYWIVLKYVSGTSATLNFLVNPLFGPGITTVKPLWPFNSPRYESTGAVEPVTWGTANTTTLEGVMSFTYSSGKTVSFCASVLAGNTTDKIYHTNDGGSAFKGVGQYWLMGKNWVNLVGFVGAVRKATANVAGGLYADLYINGAFVCKSENTIPAADIGQSSQQAVFVWPRIIAVPPQAEVMCIMKSEVNSGDDTADYYYTYTATIADDAITNAAIPLKGKIRFVLFADGVITKVDTKFMIAGLLLDMNDPFPLAPLNRRQYFDQR